MSEPKDIKFTKTHTVSLNGALTTLLKDSSLSVQERIGIYNSIFYKVAKDADNNKIDLKASEIEVVITSVLEAVAQHLPKKPVAPEK